MDLDCLYRIIQETTTSFRKGEEVTEKDVGNVKVVEVFNIPHQSEASEDLVLVDCHFIMVGVDKAKAIKRRNDLVRILKEYPNFARLKKGLSYIEVGGEIGDQGAALRLFALGRVLDFWEVITPKTMGITGKAADELAGAGMVMTSGAFLG